jgi:hypothetical protein
MPEAASTRFGVISPSTTDLVSQGDDNLRHLRDQIEAGVFGFVAASVEASRPAAAAANAWKLHRSTDTGVVAISTGSLWIALTTQYTQQPQARVTQTVGPTIPNNVFTALLFNTEAFDIGGLHSTVSNTGRLTVPGGGDGLYLIGGEAHWNSSSSGYRKLSVRLNGTTYIAHDEFPSTGAGQLVQNVSTLYRLVQTDYVELMAAQTSGADLAMQAASGINPAFWMTRISA